MLTQTKTFSARISRQLAAPVFEDEDKTRAAWLLNMILLSTFVLLALYALFSFPLDTVNTGTKIVSTIVSVLILAMWFVMRRGYVRLVAMLFLTTCFLGLTASVYFVGTIRAPGAGGYTVCVVIAGLLLGNRAVIVSVLYSLLALFVLLQAEMSGRISSTLTSVGIGQWLTFGVYLSVTAVVLRLTISSLNAALERSRGNEKALAEQAREIAIFRALAENATDAILMSTLEGKITYANRAGYEMLGWDHAARDMVGLEVADLVSAAEGADAVQEVISTVLQVGDWSDELQHRRQDGSEFYAHNTAFLIRDAAGEYAALASIVRDITQQKQAEAEHDRLQQQVIEAQKQAIQELSTPIIPLVDAPGGEGGIIVMPLIGSIDSARARDITRRLLAGIRNYRARVVIIDITGVSLVDSGVAGHLNKTIQAAQLKGARTIVTGISEGVAETIVDLGIDWGGLETLSNLQAGLLAALGSLGIKLTDVD